MYVNQLITTYSSHSRHTRNPYKGLPQGFPLFPTLYNIYSLFFIPEVPGVKIIVFADDIGNSSYSCLSFAALRTQIAVNQFKVNRTTRSQYINVWNFNHVVLRKHVLDRLPRFVVPGHIFSRVWGPRNNTGRSVWQRCNRNKVPLVLPENDRRRGYSSRGYEKHDKEGRAQRKSTIYKRRIRIGKNWKKKCGKEKRRDYYVVWSKTSRQHCLTDNNIRYTGFAAKWNKSNFCRKTQ